VRHVGDAAVWSHARAVTLMRGPAVDTGVALTVDLDAQCTRPPSCLRATYAGPR
jgi:hypothetical protein